VLGGVPGDDKEEGMIKFHEYCQKCIHKDDFLDENGDLLCYGCKDKEAPSLFREIYQDYKYWAHYESESRQAHLKKTKDAKNQREQENDVKKKYERIMSALWCRSCMDYSIDSKGDAQCGWKQACFSTLDVVDCTFYKEVIS
jgi:hypothetical protein